MRTFSIAFEDAALDESDAQEELSDFLHTDHSSLTIGHADIVANFEAALYHAEVPAFRSAFVPMFLLSKHTRDAGIKVVLSGEGADEAFLGYDLFKETQLRAAWDSLDEDARRSQLGSLYPHLDHYGPQDLAAVTGLYQQFSREHLPGLFSHELRFQNGRFSARLMSDKSDPFAAITSWAAQSPGFTGMTAVQKAQWLEFQTLLPGYLLSTQGDRMALAHGVENRCPFLDKAVVDLASSVNLRFDDGFEEKRLAAQRLQRLPAAFDPEAAQVPLSRSRQRGVCRRPAGLSRSRVLGCGACKAALSRRALCPRAGQEGDIATGDRDQHEGKPDVRVSHVAGLPAPHVRHP